MKTIGLIVNPVAGIGGPAGLKGSDGAEIQQAARARGVKSAVQTRVRPVLEALLPLREEICLLTAPGEMGADAARGAGFAPEIVGEIVSGETTAADTVRIARQMQARGAELLIFAGGDGTARNIAEAVGTAVTALGVRMSSSACWYMCASISACERRK